MNSLSWRGKYARMLKHCDQETEAKEIRPGVLHEIVEVDIATAFAFLPADDGQDQLDAMLRGEGMAEALSPLEEIGSFWGRGVRRKEAEARERERGEERYPGCRCRRCTRRG